MVENLYLDKRTLVNGADSALKQKNVLDLKEYVKDVVDDSTTKFTSLNVDTINESTSANGVVVDGVKLKDTGVEADTVSSKTTNGDLTLSGNGTGVVVVNNPLSVAGILKLTGTPQTLTGAGAVNLTTFSTLLVTTGANALTLAAGDEGQFKFIRMKTDGGDGTLTVTNLQGGTTITFNDAGDFVFLFYQDAKWHIIVNSGCTVA